MLAEHPTGLPPEQLARLFLRANTKLVSDLLQTLVSLGQAARTGGWSLREDLTRRLLSEYSMEFVPC